MQLPAHIPALHAPSALRSGRAPLPAPVLPSARRTVIRRAHSPSSSSSQQQPLQHIQAPPSSSQAQVSHAAVGTSAAASSASTVPLHADRPHADPHPLTQRMHQILSSLEAKGSHANRPTLFDSDHGLTGLSGPEGFWELLNNPDQEQTIFGGRARSATDANVLRRKGHLKEQDYLIDLMQRLHETHTCEEVMAKMERWIAQHRQDPGRSRLRRLVPRLGNFFVQLRLLDAFREYDSVFALSRRKYIPPNFAELRHIVNIAQVHASAPSLKLITFDADGTLYADGHHFEADNKMITLIINLMKSGIHVAIVTAAGYPGEPHKFETRLDGLLRAFREQKLPAEITDRFHVMGGECNYFVRVMPDTKRLQFVADDQWKTPVMKSWGAQDIDKMLRDARTILEDSAKRLNLEVTVLAKERSVGLIPKHPTIYEVLEDIALTVQNQLDTHLPFCAFNGGNDVFVDVGNKSLGLESLMAFVGAKPQETLHVGDRFTLSGNDTATRDVCSVLWVANPEETAFFIRMLINNIYKARWGAYLE